MVKGDLVCIYVDTATYSQPVSVDDQEGGIRYYAGWARKGQNALVLSNPDDWKATQFADWSAAWTQILIDGQVRWVVTRNISVLVQAEDGVVY